MARIGDEWDGTPPPFSWLGQGPTDHRGESSPWHLIAGEGPPLERERPRPAPVPDVFREAFPEPRDAGMQSSIHSAYESLTAPRDVPALAPEDQRWTEIRSATSRWTGEFTPVAGMRAWLAGIRKSLEHDR